MVSSIGCRLCFLCFFAFWEQQQSKEQEDERPRPEPAMKIGERWGLEGPRDA